MANEEAQDTADATTLRQAAEVIQRRSTRRHSFWLGVLVTVLRNAADGIERGE
jgi:hypothetical protein